MARSSPLKTKLYQYWRGARRGKPLRMKARTEMLRSPASSTPNRFGSRRPMSNVTNFNVSSKARALDQSKEAEFDKENDSGFTSKEVLLLKKLLREKERMLILQNDQMQAMQANLIQTMRRSSALNSEIIQYNVRLQKVRRMFSPLVK